MQEFSNKELDYLKLIEKAFSRRLARSETAKVCYWVAQNIPLSEIIRAFEIMVTKVSSLSFPYMAAIVDRWQEQKNGNGKTLMEQAAEIDERYGSEK